MRTTEHADKRASVLGYLAFIKDLKWGIKNLEYEIERQGAILTSITQTLGERVQTSAKYDKMGEGIERLLDLQEEWGSQVCEFTCEIEEARVIFNSDGLGRSLLWRHYVEGLRWFQLAQSTNYSERQLYRLAEESIDEVFEVIPAEWRHKREPILIPSN